MSLLADSALLHFFCLGEHVNYVIECLLGSDSEYWAQRTKYHPI